MRDEIEVAGLVDQLPAQNEFAAKIGEMGGWHAERGEVQLEKVRVTLRMVVIVGRARITFDYKPGQLELVQQHDGSWLRPRKLKAEH